MSKTAYAEWPVTPPSETDLNTVADCTYSEVTAKEDTCLDIADASSITLAQFKSNVGIS